jgi:pimeloyl-ACP methyl ester carboxylesterase
MSLVGVTALLCSPAAGAAGQVIDAAGQSQWIDCQGAGSPTIVISSGLNADHRMWSKVLPAFRKLTRTCIYDRPGLGDSPSRRGSTMTDAGEQADELRSLLSAAGESGPYVFVAHSYAGLIARAFAAENAADLAGMLLIDAVFPGIHRTYTSSYRGNWHEGGTTIDMTASERATNGGPDLGSLPLIVLTAGGSHPKGANDKRWNAEQSKAARLSSNSLHWYDARSGHVIQKDDPARVIAAVRRLVAAARTGSPLN